MRFPYFLAKRFSYREHNGKKKMQTGIAIATFGIAVGIAVMIISICVVIGFKKEIAGRVIGFGSHIQVFAYNSSFSFEKQPITIDDSIIENISKIKFVKQIDRVVTKTGIIKTNDDFKGVVFKGIDDHYDLTFFKKNMESGRVANFFAQDEGNAILISKNLSNMLGLDVGDDLFGYFFENQIRVRKFKVRGIYSTTFSDFDNLFVICNSSVIQRLNGWDTLQISSLEITLSDFSKIDDVANSIQVFVGNKFDNNHLSYTTKTIEEIYPEMFNWFDMLDTNAYIILSLMMLVAVFNMVSGLLILILEKIPVIGVLKALGMKNRDIRKAFIINAMFFVIRGIILGNIIAIGILLLQYYFHLIPLKSAYYYINYVPVSINVLLILALNISVLFLSIFIMIIPSHIITKISPIKAIKFE